MAVTIAKHPAVGMAERAFTPVCTGVSAVAPCVADMAFTSGATWLVLVVVNFENAPAVEMAERALATVCVAVVAPCVADMAGAT